MAATGGITLFCSVLLSFFSGVWGSSTCFVANSYYKVCEYGCCGTSPYEECCDNLTGLIVGLVVAGFVVICVVVAVVCIVMHHKSNKVVRLAPSAHSRGETANITILHMSSNNPYARLPDHPSQPPGHMMSSSHGGYNKQPGLAPPDVPSGFSHGGYYHAHPAPGIPVASHAPVKPSGPVKPGFPTGGGANNPFTGAGGGGTGMMMVRPNASSSINGGLTSSANSATIGAQQGMTSSSAPIGGPAMTSSSGTLNVPPSGTRTMDVGNPASVSGGPTLTPRKIPPLPPIGSPTGRGSPEESIPQPSTAFGGRPRAGIRAKEPSTLEAVGPSKAQTDMGLEDIEDF